MLGREALDKATWSRDMREHGVNPSGVWKKSTEAVKRQCRGPEVCLDCLRNSKEIMGFPGGTNDKESTYQRRRPERCGFSPRVRKIPWRRAWQPAPVFLPGKFRGQRSLPSYSPQGHKESDTPKQLCTHKHADNEAI